MDPRKSAVEPAVTNSPNDIQSVETLAEKILVEPKTVYSWMRRRGQRDCIPYYRIPGSRLLRFSLRAVLEWMSSEDHFQQRKRKKRTRKTAVRP